MEKLFFLLIWLLFAIVIGIVTKHQSQYLGKQCQIGYAVSMAYIMYVLVQVANQFSN